MTVVVKHTPMWDILHYWHAESEFLDSDGRPAKLPFSGEQGSFASLVRRFGGDIPPGAMRTELKRVGAVKEDEEGNLEVLNRYFRPKGDHESLISLLIHAVYPTIAALSHNTDPNRDGYTWPQRVAFTTAVRKSDVPRLKRIVGDRVEAFTEAIDDLFIAYETLSPNDNKEEETTLAVGVFYFEDRERDKKYKW
jgi:hypothetical protein